MKKALFCLLYACVFSLPLRATPVSFDSLPLGTVPDGVYNSQVQIFTSEEQVALFTGAHILTLPGQVQDFRFGFGRGVWVNNFDDRFDHDNPILLTIGALFLEPVDHFTLHVRDSEGSAAFHYDGVDGQGAAFSGSFLTSNAAHYTDGILDSSVIDLPAGGYFTGFTIKDADHKNTLDLTLTDFSYSVVPDGGVGLLCCAATFFGLLFVRKKLPV